MKIKHRVAAVAVVAATALALTACSGQGGSSGSGGKVEGTLTGLFDAQYKTVIAGIADDFQKKYPDVKVNFTYQGGDIGSLTLTQLQAGTAPDVLTTFPSGQPKDSADNVIPLATQGRILPIDADWTSTLPDVWAKGVTVKGKVYSFPGALQPLSAIYDKTTMDKLGLKVPTTLDEVYQLCSDAKAKGIYAYAQGLGETAAGPQMLTFAQMASLIYGTDPNWDADLAAGKVTYPDSKWVDGFTVYEKMFQSGCFGEGSLGRTRQQGQEEVAAGHAAGLVDVGAVLAGIKASAPNDEFLVTGMPVTDGTTYSTALPGYNVSVNAKAKNVAAAKAFVAFLGSKEQSAAWAKGFNSVPVIPDASFTAPTELEGFAKAVADKKFAPLTAVTNEVQQTLNKEVQAMLLGNDTPKQVAQKMQDAFKQ
jgi:raffinose/stachyose/melibiose transport system substrate-binding protein